jgi:hypothetical protein
MIMAATWDRELEDEWFERVEEMVRGALAIDENLSCRWSTLPMQLAELISQVSPYPPESFIVDAIATTIGLLLAAWKEYVEKFWGTFPPDKLLATLTSRPRLDDFLAAFGWPLSVLTNHQSLALSELQERMFRGEGGSAKEYLQRFGVSIRQPPFSCFVTVQDLKCGVFSLGETLPAFGSFVVGRQRKHNSEPEPVSFVEGQGENRLIIAAKNQPAQCSREQLQVIFLTPKHIYLKNLSEVISLKLQTTFDRAEGTDSLEEPSELNPLRLNLVQLDCGEARVVQTPVSIVFPAKILHFRNP